MYRLNFFWTTLVHVSLILSCSTLLAQQEVSIDELISPSIPAFSILGNSTEEVSRPSEPKAVVTALNSALGNNSFVSNIGIEFNPFWFSDTVLTADDYFNADKNQSITKNWERTSSISIATADYDEPIDSGVAIGKKLGLGYRFQPLIGRISDNDKEFYNDFKKKAEFIRIGDELVMIYEEKISEIDTRVKEAEDDPTITYEKPTLSKLIDNIIVNLKITNSASDWMITEIKKESLTCVNYNELLELYKKYQQGQLLLKQSTALIEIFPNYKRVGWIIEVSAATFLDFPTNEFDLSYGRRTGFWATVDYRTESGKFDFIFSPRLIFDHENNASNLDFGGRININYSDFYISGELVSRTQERRYETIDFEGNEITAVDTNNSIRYTLNFQYKLSELYSITGAFGKDWEDIIDDKSGLIAQLGLNLQFGDRKIDLANSGSD